MIQYMLMEFYEWNLELELANSSTMGFKKGDIVFKEDFTSEELEYFYYTRYFEDPVIEKPSKPDGSACITEWVCENGDWIKADWMHPKRVESCITNYNEKNCAVAEKYWNKIIPGKYCVVLNDNGIGFKRKSQQNHVLKKQFKQDNKLAKINKNNQ